MLDRLTGSLAMRCADLNNLKLPEHTARLEEVAEEQKFESTNSTQLAQILQVRRREYIKMMFGVRLSDVP